MDGEGASRWADQDRLNGGTLVATVMSNLGLERYLDGRGLRLERTAVGDRYVVEAMRANGWNLGGEQSGHIVMTDFATTGDGLLAGLQFLLMLIVLFSACNKTCMAACTGNSSLQNVFMPATCGKA